MTSCFPDLDRVGQEVHIFGTWIGETTDGTPTDQTIDSQNQITAKGSDSYSYDYNGNLTQDYDDARDGTTTTEYLYDAWNRLVYINVDDGDDPVGYTNISYSADGDDAISQTQICTGDTETTTNSYYDLASRVIETDVTSSGSGSGSGCSSGCSSGSGPTTLVSQYVWGLGYVNDLLERDDQAGSDGTGVSYGIASGGTTRRLYALTDANYDVVAIANHSGGVVERFQYDPYGAVGPDSRLLIDDRLFYLERRLPGRRQPEPAGDHDHHVDPV